jgi:dTDP-glucose pyrophosphorylase
MFEYNLVIPMAGLGSRFVDAGYTVPKPLLPIGDHRVFEVVIANFISPGLRQVSLVAPSSFKLSRDCFMLSQKLGLPVSLIEIDKVTTGPASTVALGLNSLTRNLPVIVANSDQFLSFEIEKWLVDIEERRLDGSILVMRDRDPKWSYVKLNAQGNAVDIREKEVISDMATCGAYFFESVSYLTSLIARQSDSNQMVNGEYYVAPLYNYFEKDGKEVGIFDLGPVSKVMFGLGTPVDYESFVAGEELKIATERTKQWLG